MIVGRLLAFGRPVMTNRHMQEMQPLIHQAIKMVHEPMQQKNIQISVHELEKGLEADVDGPQIIQVLINLLLNAIEASPASGTVRLTAEGLGPNVCMRISDEGSRIPDDVRQHVFDAYYTTKPDGSGLGLAVSREIVANHGGALEFESENAAVLSKVAPRNRASARNLLHYLSIRQTDIRELQHDLHSLGLSSLGVLESHVLATLIAVITNVEALAGDGGVTWRSRTVVPAVPSRYEAILPGRGWIGEASVVIAVAAPHRDVAFEACRYAIDRFKGSLPTKKKETYLDGTAHEGN